MPTADTRTVDREDGFTLIELLLVLIVMAILLAAAVGFQTSARERASDATARANIRTAVPAIEAFHTDAGTYAGMTLGALQTSYSPGVEGITVVSSGSATYWGSASTNSSTWYKAGPGGPITQTACS